MIGRLATKRIGLPRAVALATCVCTGILLSLAPVTGQEKALKKLYISSITADGVSAPLAKKARERLEFALYEHFGKEYRVLTDEDVKVMFKKAGEIMATGCNAESCQQQMADAVDADEIIYGELSSEGAALKLSARTLLRDRKTLSVTKKSMVMLGFAEKELEHYCGEAARKLVNPAYAVQKPPKAAFEEGISLSAVKVEAVKGLDIGVMKFTADDEAIRSILGYLKGLVQEGDDAFGSKKYDAALGKYTTVLERVRTKLSADKQSRMANFTGGVVKRCDTAYAMTFKERIENLDGEIKSGENASEDVLTALRGKYRKIEFEACTIPDELTGAGMAEIFKTLTQRHDDLAAAMAGAREKKGDALYGEYRFDEALDEYRQAGLYAAMLRGTAKKTALANAYRNKRKVTVQTGRNYLLSRVRALIDRAEFFNVQEKTKEAIDSIGEARTLITGKWAIFSTPDSVDAYNTVAAVLSQANLTRESNPKVFNAGDEVQKIEKSLETAESLFAREGKQVLGGGKVYFLGGIEFVYILGGSFMMGSPEGEGEDDEHPQHKVTLDGFWMSRNEITQAQYEAIIGENPSRFKGADRPVEMVRWDDATVFCEKLSARGGATVRLPTEAEWEYACRAGTSTRYYWGDEMNDEYCWHYGNSNSETHPVGGKKPNAWGLYDMSGNTCEWCQDWYDKKYYSKSPEKNPVGPKKGEYRVLRGGDRSTNRDGVWSGLRSYSLGIRVVLAP